MIVFKKLTESERARLLSDGWDFDEWLQQMPECESRQLRHVIRRDMTWALHY
jgi:ribosomal 50S subunit-associated protein YjgA (DUF615 family)